MISLTQARGLLCTKLTTVFIQRKKILLQDLPVTKLIFKGLSLSYLPPSRGLSPRAHIPPQTCIIF